MGFLLGRATNKGIPFGIIVAILFTAWNIFTSVEIQVIQKILLYLGIFNYALNPKLIGILPNIFLFLIGWIVSSFRGAAKVDYTHSRYGA